MAEKPKHAFREAQAARTRERLLQAAAQFFEKHPASELTLPKLARLAGVTPPTAYANFETIDELLKALYEWVLPRLGTRDPWPPPEQLPDLPRLRYPRFSEHGGLLRSIWTSGSWSRHRKKTRSRYVEEGLKNLRSLAPHLKEVDALTAFGPIISFAYPPMWQWLRDVFGLSEEQTEQAAVWAMHALIEAMKTAPPSSIAAGPATKKRKKTS